MNIKDFQNEYFKVIGEHEINKNTIVKFGIDPTSPDIHLGHMVVLRQLRRLQDLGATIHFVIGGFTATIGDPTGVDVTRPSLDEHTIASNYGTYVDQMYKLIDSNKILVTFNSDGLCSDLDAAGFIKLMSSVTLSKMLEHNTFKKRFEGSNSIRVHELVYPLLQAYDSIVIEPHIEVGGMDQLFNFTLTRDIQVFYGQQPESCLLCPILLGTCGKQKMSKSLGNYIGITEDPDVMRDKLSRMPDSNVESYMKLLTPFTDYDSSDILATKKILMYNIIMQLHGKEKAQEAMDNYGRKKKVVF